MFVLLLLLAQAIVAGVVQAFLYSKKGADSIKGDEHNWFIADRVLIWSVALLPSAGWYIFAIPFFYPLFYNGAYYYMRNKIDGSYSKGWKSDPSNSSTADLNLSFERRVQLGIVGLIITLLIILL
jgi:hypothetical protein